MHSTMMRLFGLGCAIVPPTLLAHNFWAHGDEKHGERMSYVIALFLLTCIVSLPGGYVAVVGPKPNPDPGLRARSLVQIATAIGMFAIWLLAMVVGNYITALFGVMFLWYGILGIGAVNLSLGVFSLISNRALLQEMSEINLLGRSQDAESKKDE
jgi:hypothetical protein